MREKIENRLVIACNDVDLTKITDIEFYVSQMRFFGCYKPTVISNSEMVVVIPFEDAKRLQKGDVKLQFAFRDANGNSDASEVVVENVNELLKEAGYDPV